MVAVHHVREELLCQVVVGERVDFERQIEILLGSVEDSFAARDARVVDQDGRVAERSADLLGGIFD